MLNSIEINLLDGAHLFTKPWQNASFSTKHPSTLLYSCFLNVGYLCQALYHDWWRGERTLSLLGERRGKSSHLSPVPGACSPWRDRRWGGKKQHMDPRTWELSGTGVRGTGPHSGFGLWWGGTAPLSSARARGVLLHQTDHSSTELVSKDGLQPISFAQSLLFFPFLFQGFSAMMTTIWL